MEIAEFRELTLSAGTSKIQNLPTALKSYNDISQKPFFHA